VQSSSLETAIELLPESPTTLNYWRRREEFEAGESRREASLRVGQLVRFFDDRGASWRKGSIVGVKIGIGLATVIIVDERDESNFSKRCQYSFSSDSRKLTLEV
jgi:hypothetical protein